MEWATNLGVSDSSFINVQEDESQNPNDHHTSSCLGRSLSLSYFPDAGGRGLRAVRDLGEGELILAVALLNEVAKGKRSWWYPYLTQFPASYDILSSFDQFEIQALQLEDAIWAAEKAVEKTKLEWISATAIMEDLSFKPRYLSFKAWVWASASISSRTMHIPWDPAGCFCPVGDLFNYAAPGEEQVIEDSVAVDMGLELDGGQAVAKSLRLTDGVFEEESGAYCFYARKNYRKGDQVLLSYGTYTNLELLEHYGFVLNRNPNDKAYIPLPPDLYSLCSWPGKSLYIHQNGKPSFALVSAMRVWRTPAHQRKSVRQLAYSGSLISTVNEILVMEWLAEKCRIILKNFPTSIEEDKLLLAMEVKKIVVPGEATRSLDKRKLAIRWRLGYKMMLHDCISYCVRVIGDLSGRSSNGIGYGVFKVVH